MCCRTLVRPLDKAIAQAILVTGLFESDGYDHWRRKIPEEEATVTATFSDDGLLLSISPPVSSMEGHHHKRIAASVSYEIAARYAEKVDGEISQIAINVPACMTEGTQKRTLASYPSSRLDFGQLCQGFREVFVGEVE